MTTLLLIHGMGAQDENLGWFHEALGLWLPMSGIQWAPFYWEDLRNPPTAGDLAAGRKIGWSQWAALSSLSDLISYGSCLHEVFKRLDEVIASIEGDVVLVAHSLGSVVAYQFLALLWGKGKVKGLITLGSPVGRQPVCGKVKKRLNVPWWKSLPKLLKSIPWINIAGGSDYVTSWFGGGLIKEADVNMVVPFAGHDLRAYIGSQEFRQAVRGLLGEAIVSPS